MSAQNNIDQIVLNFFGKNKFFIEAGGSHPIDQNNTFLLESNEWKGLVVEPKLDFNEWYSAIRPNTIMENYVLVSKDYDKDTIMGDFSHYMVGGIYDNKITNYWNPTPHKCTTLQKILDKHKIDEVHFFSLDVEGYEKDVLGGIDFEKTFIHLMVIESHSFHGFSDASSDFSFLEKYNFEKVKTIDQHEFYINKKSEYYNKISDL